MSVTVTSTPFQVSVDDAGTSVTVAATVADGTGLPAGGTSGQILAKTSGTDYAVAFITRTGSYTGQIETGAVKEYTLDPAVVTARTITAVFYIKSTSGTVTATLKNGSNTVKAASVTTSSGDQSSLANTSVAVNGVISIVMTSNSSATDVIFAVEYTE